MKLLLSDHLASCHTYGDTWDIKFNPLKSQTITFGGPNPSQCQIAMEDRPMPWVSKIKYLGVYFCCNNGDTDLTDVCRKFYGHLNSILSVDNTTVMLCQCHI